MMPIRIQRSRAKGWRMPENTVYVGRPSWLGNDWTMRDAAIRRIRDPRKQREWAVEAFKADVAASYDVPGTRWHRDRIAALRGKNLACWCPLNQPCHADVLLEIANSVTAKVTKPRRTRKAKR
jgi:hypothetical protein